MRKNGRAKPGKKRNFPKEQKAGQEGERHGGAPGGCRWKAPSGGDRMNTWTLTGAKAPARSQALPFPGQGERAPTEAVVWTKTWPSFQNI